MAVTTYVFSQTVGSVDYVDDYFKDKYLNLETVFSDYKAQVHYWEISGNNDVLTVYTYDNQTLLTLHQDTIHALLDDISNVEVPDNQEPYHNQTPYGVQHIVSSADATFDLEASKRVIYAYVFSGAVVTLNMLDKSLIENDEAYEFILTVVFNGAGSGIHMQTQSPSMFRNSGLDVFGIIESGTYRIVQVKSPDGTMRISVGLTGLHTHTSLTTPDKYIKFDYDSHFEVASADLTGNLVNCFDMAQQWTVSGIVREHDTSAGSVMFNRWSNSFGINRYNGSNIFNHTINGNGGGYYFDTAYKYIDYIGKRFFIVNWGTELKCYIEDQVVFTSSHSGVNSTSVNGQLFVGVRKHYSTILQGYLGGLDDVILFDEALDSTKRNEVLNSSDLTTLSNYNLVGAYWKMGEDTFPNIHDTKRNVDNTYVNGQSTDYKDV